MFLIFFNFIFKFFYKSYDFSMEIWNFEEIKIKKTIKNCFFSLISEITKLNKKTVKNYEFLR